MAVPAVGGGFGIHGMPGIDQKETELIVVLPTQRQVTGKLNR